MSNVEQMLAEIQSVGGYGRRYVAYLNQLLAALDFSALGKFVEVLMAARQAGRTVFLVGNGGSAATASHWATDLGQGTRVPGGPLFRTLSLTDNMAAFSALGNDRGYSEVFVGQLEGLFQPGDVLVAISASGKSPNVLRAIEYANAHGGTTVGLLGFDGGQMKSLCHLCIHVETPKGEYGPVEDIHLIVDHLVTGYIRARLQASVPPPRIPEGDQR